MPFCAIKCCGKKSGTSSYTKDGITFHRFPKDPNIKDLWITACVRENWFPAKDSVVCSRHFTSDCFEQLNSKRRRLYPSAIPTLWYLGKDSIPIPTDAIFGPPNNRQRMESSVLRSSEPQYQHSKQRTDPAAPSAGADSDSSDDAMTVDGWCGDDGCSASSRRAPAAKDAVKKSGLPQGAYYCNGCGNVITGFRYTCLQCSDVDLCASCERTGLHAAHYVLRVPGRRPEEEVTCVLGKIRAELFKLHSTVESIEIQIKEESEPFAAVEEVYIHTVMSPGSQPMKQESQKLRTEMDAKIVESDIPNKMKRVEMEEFLYFKDRSASVQSTSTAMASESVGDAPPEEPGIKDVKAEDGVDTEARCEVFVHRDASCGLFNTRR